MLTSMLQQSQYEVAIDFIKEILLDTVVCQWSELIEEAHKNSAIENSESVQKFLDELKDKYVEIKQLNKDLTQSDDERFSMFMLVVTNAPNYRQFALAQYCIALLGKEPRQLWCVPSG